MSSEYMMLGFFPTPYPDEILYSVLCRYHIRNGSPPVNQTNRDLWDKRIGENFLLPCGVKRISTKLPSKSKFSTKRFIAENTIFPLLKPFLAYVRGETLRDAMKNGTNGHTNTFNIAGLPSLKYLRRLHLCYCPYCMTEDIKTYGEAYWHRIHQLFGILICPKCGTSLMETDIPISMLTSEFHPATPKPLQKELKAYSDDVTEKLKALACDTKWLLENGNELGYYESTQVMYDKWLRVRGFRGWNGKTWNKKLYAAIIDYYGQDLLSILHAYDTGIISWVQRLLQHKNSLSNPIFHILLMSFLAGSAEKFFCDECEIPVPFGNPPWPCRNAICEHHLKDVIDNIDIRCVKGIYKATFICPHCGLIYRRKRALPKERQYTGQIDVVDYGWLWKDRLRELLIQNMPISTIMQTMHCDFYIVLKYGVEMNLLPKETLRRRKSYVPKPICQIVDPCKRDKTYHRQAWKAAIKKNPESSRSELIMLAHKSYEWLRANDLDWFEKNSPAPRKSIADWNARDNEYLELVKVAIEQIKMIAGKPLWINRNSVGHKCGVLSLHNQIASGNLPKTSQYLQQHLESAEEWRRRKILWAIQELCAQGKRLTPNKIKLMACISNEAFKSLVEFTTQHMQR